MPEFGSGNSTVKETATTLDLGGKALDVVGAITAGDIVVDSVAVSAMGVAPASAIAAGVEGTIIVEAAYIYVCTATNTWKRVAIATW